MLQWGPEEMASSSDASLWMLELDLATRIEWMAASDPGTLHSMPQQTLLTFLDAVSSAKVQLARKSAWQPCAPRLWVMVHIYLLTGADALIYWTSSFWRQHSNLSSLQPCPKASFSSTIGGLLAQCESSQLSLELLQVKEWRRNIYTIWLSNPLRSYMFSVRFVCISSAKVWSAGFASKFFADFDDHDGLSPWCVKCEWS